MTLLLKIFGPVFLLIGCSSAGFSQQQQSTPVDYNSLKTKVTGLEILLGGKKDKFISKQWMMEHPQVTVSLPQYSVINYSLAWMCKKQEYNHYGAVNNNASDNVIRSLAGKLNDSCYVFIEDVVVQYQGKPAAADRAVFSTRIVN